MFVRKIGLPPDELPFLPHFVREIGLFPDKITLCSHFVRKIGLSPDKAQVIFAYSDKSFTFASDMTMTYKLIAILGGIGERDSDEFARSSDIAEKSESESLYVNANRQSGYLLIPLNI